MSAYVLESYSPKRMTAPATLANPGQAIGFFFCTTSGTLSITNTTLAGGSDLVSSFTVTAGTYYPLPLMFPNGAYAALAGGAAGTFGMGQ